jgi:hypothetical protein
MKHPIIAALLVLPCALSTAFAQESGSFKVSGFGTGALTWTDTDDAEFARASQASGAGKTPRTGVDSNLGLQVDYTANSWLSFTGQGLVRKDGREPSDDNFGAELTWAFAKAKLSDNLSVRAGRIGLPVFMISDYRNVGYANTMLRPAQEVYSQIPVGHLDGADVTWQQSIADTDFTAQLGYGRTKSGPAVISGEHALNLVAEHGPVTVRVGHAGGDLQLTIPVGPPGGPMHVISLPKQKVSFTAAGLSLDWNNIVVQSEAAKTRGMGPTVTSWYAMAGYRFGKLLPYYNHGKVTGATAQTTESLGLRWDAFRSADIKFQIDRVKPETTGLFVHAKPGFRGPVTVGAVAIDFVF